LERKRGCWEESFRGLSNLLITTTGACILKRDFFESAEK